MKKTTHAAEQNRPDVAAARRWWRRQQPQWDSGRLVSIDETSLNTKMARLCGRSLRGQRCLSSVPRGHWQTSTFIAALRQDRIGAPFLIEGSANMEIFAAYVGQVLCPELHAANISTRKQLLNVTLRGLSLFDLLVRALQAAANHEIDDSVFLDQLARSFPRERPQRVLRTVVAWARYAALFKYDSTRRVFHGLQQTPASSDPPFSPNANPSQPIEG